MTSEASPFLPGVPEAAVREAPARAAGNEVESGKFNSPQSGPPRP